MGVFFTWHSSEHGFHLDVKWELWDGRRDEFARREAMHLSAGIALVGLDDADAVISEFEVGSGQFNFGHVAGDAVVFCDVTGFGFDFSAAMAGLALCVIVARLSAHLRVRVVAGHATDARIVGIVAQAAPKPVRLEANVIDAVVLTNHDF